MGNTETGRRERDRTPETVRHELEQALAQKRRLEASLRPGSHPCDRSETGHQISILAGRIYRLEQELKNIEA